MATRVYATGEQYRVWLGLATVPDGADRALRVASEIVDEMLLTAVYDTNDTTQLPTDAGIATVLQDATCAQAEFLREGSDTGAVGVSGTGSITKFSIGGLSVDRSGSAGGAGTIGANPQLPGHWSPRAYRILSQEPGLIGTSPWGT